MFYNFFKEFLRSFFDFKKYLKLRKENKEIIFYPKFTMKGIIFIENLNEILEKISSRIKYSIVSCFENNILELSMIEEAVKDKLKKFIFKKIRIKPMIITRVMDMAVKKDKIKIL